MDEPGTSQDAIAGMESRPAHPFLAINGCSGDAFAPQAGEVATIAISAGPLPAMEGQSNPALADSAVASRCPGREAGQYKNLGDEWPYEWMGFDRDGFYTSHGELPEAFGALPCRTVASAHSDAPPSAALTAELTRSEPAGGGNGTGSLPSTVPASNAFSRNASGPLSLDTTTNSAV